MCPLEAQLRRTFFYPRLSVVLWLLLKLPVRVSLRSALWRNVEADACERRTDCETLSSFTENQRVCAFSLFFYFRRLLFQFALCDIVSRRWNVSEGGSKEELALGLFVTRSQGGGT